MPGRSTSRRDCRTRGPVVAGVLLALAASAAAQALPCHGALPAPGAAATTAAAGGSKFRLIAQQCPALGEPVAARGSEQLDLFDHSTVVSLSLAGAPEDARVTPAAMPDTLVPLGRDAARVLSLAPALTAAARANDLDPLLLHAIAHVESRHNAQAVSPAGARGVMQLMPATAQRFGVDRPERTLFDAGTNLNAGAAYLRTLRSRYGNDLRLMLAAYNAGEGAVDKHGRDVPPYPETQAYVRDVLAIYSRLTAMFGVSPSGTLVARGERS